MERTIVIGDVHGCLEELVELMEELDVKSSDKLVFLGDLIDRGPMPVETVRFVRELECGVVLGNHEEKCVRWHRHEARRRETGKPNPMRPPSPDRQKQWEGLSEEDLEWMRKLPLTLELAPSWIAVHGGFEPKPLGQQRADRIIRMRYLDEKTREPTPLDKDLEQPPGTVYWTELWDQPHSVVYGHAVHGSSPRVDWRSDVQDASSGAVQFNPRTWCIGVDTGCCFGGMLTALVTDDGFRTWTFVQVKAKRAYQQLIPGMNAIKPLPATVH